MERAGGQSSHLHLTQWLGPSGGTTALGSELRLKSAAVGMHVLLAVQQDLSSEHGLMAELARGSRAVIGMGESIRGTGESAACARRSSRWGGAWVRVQGAVMTGHGAEQCANACETCPACLPVLGGNGGRTCCRSGRGRQRDSCHQQQKGGSRHLLKRYVYGPTLTAW